LVEDKASPQILIKPAKYTFTDGERGFVLQIKFGKAHVELEEVAAAIDAVLKNLGEGRLSRDTNSG
jgi:hypothetical protein